MRLIPGKTKVKIEFFKGVSLWDIIVAVVGIVMVVAVLLSSLPHRFYIILVVLFVFGALLARLDATPNYVLLLHILRHFAYKRHYERVLSDDVLLVMSGEKSREQVLDELTDLKERDKVQAEESKNTGKQTKEQKKAEAALYREESKKLKDKRVSEEEKDEIWKARAARSAAKKRKKAQHKADNRNNHPMEEIIPFTDIKDGLISYGGKYYGAVLEIPPVEFRFFSEHRRSMSIDGGVGKVLRNINPEYSANIVKIERPINYDEYLEREYQKTDNLRRSYESGLLNEDELKARVEIMYDRLNDLEKLCYKDPVIVPYYYLVLYGTDKRQLETEVRDAQVSLDYGELEARRLSDKELAIFLKYTNEIDFDERQIEKIRPEDYAAYAMPNSVEIRPRTVLVNNIQTFNMRITAYPSMVSDAWLATVMSMPATKVVVKCKPMERDKAVHAIDRSLGELRGQLMTTGVDSKALELREHISSLSELLSTLQQENETLLQVNIYITSYDLIATRNNPKIEQPPLSNRSTFGNMKKTIRRLYQENGFRVSGLDFEQMHGFIGSQISGWDPMLKEGRGIPSNSVAAAYPWVFANVSDVGGFKLGSSDGVPVFLNFFRRDSERVNSNMVIVGKSGSGKSYATKDILTNLAAEDAKIFILDPENEYSELAKNLHGKFINVGNAQQGRINPFHIITIADDEEDGAAVTGSYATHLQFLEEFFRQILPDCDKDALEYLNNLVDRMYSNFGITAETDLSVLRPEDYPIFDDLYDVVLAEFQQTQNDYIRTNLRSLMNYIAKFSTGGRNANIWNGPSTITTDENFTVFNFQSLLSNRNGTIANAQMLLVLKYIDNEIIKNRDYNMRYKLNRKIVVAIDEAHVFIDTKFPVALDFMFQLAKRIRKYNGMQIVITQNIKDFVGSEEIARKSTAIINACQYSLIFALAPNDMQDLCTLYEKAGGINEMEQEQIMMAPRGQAFAVMGPSSRSMFRVDVPEPVVEMFSEDNYQTQYFAGESGAENWEAFIGNSRELWEQNKPVRLNAAVDTVRTKKKVTFTELTPEEILAESIREDMKQEYAGTDTVSGKSASTRSTVSFTEAKEGRTSDVTFTEMSENETSGVKFTEMHENAASGVRFAEISENDSSGVSFMEIPEEKESRKVVEETSERRYSDTTSERQEPTELEKLLAQTLGQFSHDAIAEQIRKAVQEEVQRELANLKAAEYRKDSSDVDDFREDDDFEDSLAEPTEPQSSMLFGYYEDNLLNDEDDYEDDLSNDEGDEGEFDEADFKDDESEYNEDDFEDNESEYDKDEYDEADFKDDESEYDKDEYDEDDFDDNESEYDKDEYDEDDFDDNESGYNKDDFEDDEDEDDEDEFDDDEDEYDKDESEDEDDTDDDIINIFADLMKKANTMESINPIEMMEVYDEEVVDITLEDLASYIRANR